MASRILGESERHTSQPELLPTTPANIQPPSHGGFSRCSLKTLQAFSKDGVSAAPGPDMWEQRGGPEQGAPRREAQEAGDMEITC